MNGVQLLLIIGTGIAVSAVARRRNIEPGMIIVVLAAAASFLPGMPRLELDSELILAIVVPPLLYSATRHASFASFGANLRAIATLGVLLVVLSTGVLGLVASWLLPSLGVAAAYVLGAVLAPPDTITTVTHGEELGLPARVTSILTGESLVNDATALTLFTIAVGAVNGAHTTVRDGAVELLHNSGVGIGIGALLAIMALWIRKRLRNSTLETALVLLVPFTAFLAAEELHASGILAVVMAAFSISVNLTLDPANAEGDAARRVDRHAGHPHSCRGGRDPRADRIRRALSGPGCDPGDRTDSHAGHTAAAGHHDRLAGPQAAVRPRRRADAAG